MLLPFPSFFEFLFLSDEEPIVFPITVGAYSVPCPICQKKTIRHAQTLRHFRHGYTWPLGFICHRCVTCDLTFTYDFGLGIAQVSSAMFRRELVRRCHGRSIAYVAPEYELPYTTVARWYYLLAADELTEEILSV